MNLRTVKLSIQESVATIVLSRPDAANGFNQELADDVLAAARHCANNPSIRAVLLTGDGKMFSGGGDLTALAAGGECVGELLAGLTASLHAAISLFVRMNPPLVIALNGTAAGAGFSLALAGDYVIAAASAKLTMAYTRIGVSPDAGGSYFLPRLVGMARAKEILLFNPVYSADEALVKGLIHEVVPDAELLNRATNVAQQLAAGPTSAFGSTKRLLADSFSTSLEAQLAYEAQSIASLAMTTQDARESFRAFVEKRKHVFSGS